MRRLKTLLATLALLGLLGGLLVAGSQTASAAPAVTVSASKSAPGSRADLLARDRSSRRAVWTSAGTPVGTVLTTRFARRTHVDGMLLRGAGAALRMTDARIRFSDGSTLAVHTSASGDRSITFPARSITWVRLVVAGVPKGRASVGLSGWRFHVGSATRRARPAGDAVGAARLDASSGRATRTGWRAVRAGDAQWMRARWDRPIELSAVRIFGGGTAATSTRSGYLRFSDGSRVKVGTLEPRGGTPTTIAFTPRMTTFVRFVASEVPKGAHAAVRRIAAYAVGVVPPVTTVPAAAFRSVVPAARSCTTTTASPTDQLILRCPSNGARVGSAAQLVVSGPVGAMLEVVAHRPNTSSATQRVAAGTVDASGIARLTVPMRKLAHGPTAVRITASGVASALYVQLENSVGIREREPTDTSAQGMDLKLDEEFDAPLSVTRTGADAQYASGKPNSYGVDDFGDAIFAQPSTTEHNLGTGGGYLRIRSRALTATQTDPAGYGRRFVGGLISSGHMGGSGFAAQYGYFEARMLGPAGKGTWPAFWLLSTGSLTRYGASTGEIDAAELYGHDPGGECQTAHSWVGGRDVLGRGFCKPLDGGGDFALSWHTYGARVTPSGTTFTIDGRVTAQTAAVVGSAQPFFFLVDLALGGGWPVDLSGTHSRVSLYVDRVRVWV